MRARFPLCGVPRRNGRSERGERGVCESKRATRGRSPCSPPVSYKQREQPEPHAAQHRMVDACPQWHGRRRLNVNAVLRAHSSARAVGRDASDGQVRSVPPLHRRRQTLAAQRRPTSGDRGSHRETAWRALDSPATMCAHQHPAWAELSYRCIAHCTAWAGKSSISFPEPR